MSATSLVRKTYDGIALFSVLNVVFVGGLVAYLISSGAVDAEKFRKFVAVIRGAEFYLLKKKKSRKKSSKKKNES